MIPPIPIPLRMGNEESKLRAALVCERRNLIMQDALIGIAQKKIDVARQKSLESVNVIKDTYTELKRLGLANV